jgi:hypothetical protein
MAVLPANRQLTDFQGRPLYTLRDINALKTLEKESIYAKLIPRELLERFAISRKSLTGADGVRKVDILAPSGLGLVRIEVRAGNMDIDPVFFLEIADTGYHQMNLSLCIIRDPESPRFDVDRDEHGRDNLFATMGRNIPEEIKAMRAGLFPYQTRRGMRMFPIFLSRFERFVDSLAMEIINAEPLSYDNAIRYEKYGFDYLLGHRLMTEINDGFKPGGRYQAMLDGSTPFRSPGFERTVRGRSWAIHDGILGRPWGGLEIYLRVGFKAGVNTFPERDADS